MCAQDNDEVNAGSVGDELEITLSIWGGDERYVITCTSDKCIRVRIFVNLISNLKLWDSFSGSLLGTQRNHTSLVHLMEAHPTDHRLFVSVGCDGLVCLWTLPLLTIVKGIFDQSEKLTREFKIDAKLTSASFCHRGDFLAVGDESGTIHLFGLGKSAHSYEATPVDQFFSTDFDLFVYDEHLLPIHEQHRLPWHLIEHGPLVDMNLNAYYGNCEILSPLFVKASVDDMDLIARNMAMRQEMLVEELDR